jgi:hypothetical protein
MNPQAPKIILAIAPDPVHTNGSLLFDRYIDAVEDALQDSGWDYQGSWMPWRTGGGKPDGTIEDKEEERLFDRGREEYPGVILFRPSDSHPSKPSRPLILVVAGDSPTSGVVASQFQHALQIFLKLSSATAPLNILGPDYTGSGPSLYALLRDAKQINGKPLLDRSRTISIASGSVSDWYCEHIVPGAQKAVANAQDCGNAAGQFKSFGVDSRWEVQQTESFLDSHGGVGYNEIAELSEDESGFGELLSNQNDLDNPILHLKFPRGISHLRSAYQKNSVWGFGGSSGASNINLSLDFEEPRQVDDSVQSFAPQQLPVSQEASMGEVASILEGKQIKAVLVSASDVLDELFVAKFLSQQAPNVMVILRGTDVLFLRSGDGSAYRNMYAVGPWPLIPENAAWTMPPKERSLYRSFPSGDSEGVYIATRYLVGERTDQLQDYRSPLSWTESSRPPLWFLMVGRGAFWPVALLDATSGAPRSQINLPPLRQRPRTDQQLAQTPSLPQRLMLLIAVALSLLHAGKCLRLRLLERVAPWYHSYEESTRIPKLLLQLSISILGIVMVCLVYEPPVGSNPGGNWMQELPWRLLFFLAITFLSLAAVQVCWLLRGQEDSRVIDLRVLGILPVFVFLSFVLWFAIWYWLPGSAKPLDGMAMFFGYRSRHPLSGASPVFPVFIALNALTLILLARISLFNFSTSMAPRVPDQVPARLNCPGPRAIREISVLLEWPIEGTTLYQKAKTLRPKLELFAIIASTVLVVASATDVVPRMFEQTRTRVLLSTTLFLIVVGLLWDLSMAALLWNRLRAGCLIPLESSALRSGFNSISGLTWKTLWLMPQTTDVQYRALTRSLEQAMRKVMDCWAGEPVNGESLRDAIEEMWQSFADGHQRETILKFGEVQNKMAATGQKVLLHLQQLWTREEDLVTATDRVEENHLKTDSEPKVVRLRTILEEWVALLYIHYIRLILVQVRTRVATAAMVYILVVWTIASYPFINRHSLTIGLSALLGVLAIVVISTYASINRDPVLCRTINQAPDGLDFDFFLKTASMVGIPLLGLVASQFPEVSRFLFSWIEPGLVAVR